MAYVNQDKKAKIAAALKPVMPKGWKYSLAVRHHSTLVLTISAAPFDLLRAMAKTECRDPSKLTHAEVNPYHVRACFADECVADVFEAIRDAMNTDNHDRSDLQTDYHDVGHYISICIGRWDKPFTVLAAEPVRA